MVALCVSVGFRITFLTPRQCEQAFYAEKRYLAFMDLNQRKDSSAMKFYHWIVVMALAVTMAASGSRADTAEQGVEMSLAASQDTGCSCLTR